MVTEGQQFQQTQQFVQCDKELAWACCHLMTQSNKLETPLHQLLCTHSKTEIHIYFMHFMQVFKKVMILNKYKAQFVSTYTQNFEIELTFFFMPIS